MFAFGRHTVGKLQQNQVLTVQPLATQLAERFPKWFTGPRAVLTKPIVRGISRWSRLDQIQMFLDENRDLKDWEFLDASLDYLGVHHHAWDAELEHIPKTGRALIVANHPLGALDALALLKQISKVRKDVRIIANDMLMQLTNLQGLFLPVRIIGGQAGAQSVDAIEKALNAEECVVIFPAGEVSRLGLKGIVDGPWRRGFVRFARRTQSPIVPAKIRARNSVLFYGASTIHKSIGTSLLAREMFSRRGRRLQLRIGEPMLIPSDMSSSDAIVWVRSTLEQLDARALNAPKLQAEPLIDVVDTDLVAAEIATLKTLGETSDGHLIVCGKLASDSNLMREVARLRELTFREVGEGTGRAMDMDVFDAWYEHIVLWDRNQLKIAGAYRVARGAKVLAERGIQGWYTASLFEYSEGAIARIAKGMELGRSFVAPEYWGGRSIDYLWQGIGAYLNQYPSVRYLYGPVSISAALPTAARDQIVAYYAKYYGCENGLGRSKSPFAYFEAPPQFADLDAPTAFKVLRSNLDSLGAALPMLYKQYTELCEPGGVKFLAFGVDKDFQNAIDGLIEVDIEKMRPHKRARYIQRTKH